MSQRSVQLAILGWIATNALVLALAGDALPFDWADRATTGRLVGANLALLEVFILMAVVHALTRRRNHAALAERASGYSDARRETLSLLMYGAAGLLGGFALGRAFGWHPIGFHVAGTLYSTADVATPTEALVWAAYNLVVYAVLPLIYFRRRYSAEALYLKSTDRRSDALVIIVVLVIESIAQYFALRSQIFTLSARQLALGAPLAFALYFIGTVVPAMIFIYALLVPRFLALTRSTATTVIFGGVTYTIMHVWDAWTVFASPAAAALSIAFLFLTYFGPGMIKTVLTLRTGNAWVHAWAYHALAPHTFHDTPLIVRVFRIR